MLLLEKAKDDYRGRAQNWEDTLFLVANIWSLPIGEWSWTLYSLVVVSIINSKPLRSEPTLANERLGKSPEWGNTPPAFQTEVKLFRTQFSVLLGGSPRAPASTYASLCCTSTGSDNWLINNGALGKPAKRGIKFHHVTFGHDDGKLAVDDNWSTKTMLETYRPDFWKLEIRAKRGETVEYMRIHRDDESGKCSSDHALATGVFG